MALRRRRGRAHTLSCAVSARPKRSCRSGSSRRGRLLERQGGRLNEAEAKAALDAATARFEEAERALKEALLRVGVLRRKRTLKLREIGRL